MYTLVQYPWAACSFKRWKERLCSGIKNRNKHERMSAHFYARRAAQLLVGLYMLVYLGFICGENCRLRDFGIIFLRECLKPQPSIMQSQKFSGRCFSAGAGADMPAGLQWCLIFSRTRSRWLQENRSDGYGILHFRVLLYLFLHFWSLWVIFHCSGFNVIKANVYLAANAKKCVQWMLMLRIIPVNERTARNVYFALSVWRIVQRAHCKLRLSEKWGISCSLSKGAPSCAHFF